MIARGPSLVWRKVAALLAIPFLLMALHPELRFSQGPKYLEPWVDPDYAYLLNSLAVAKGSYPGHMDHPGATVHALGAAVLRIVPSGSDVETVLRDPERFAAPISFALVAITATFLFVSGWLVAGLEGFGILDGVLFQLWPFLFGTTWQNFPRITPDFLGFGFSALLLGLLLYCRPSLRAGIALGSITGLTAATKLSALLLPLVPFLAWRKEWKKLPVICAAGGIVYGGLIGFLYRGHIKYFLAYSFRFVTNLATHKGVYGDGEAAAPSLQELLSGALRVVQEVPLFAVSAVLGLILCAWMIRRPVPRRDAWVAVFLLPLAQLLLVSKAAQTRYAMPAFPASALVVIMGLRFANRPMRMAALPVCFALAGWAFLQVDEFGRRHREQADEAERAIPEGSQRICFGLGAEVNCGLAFGNQFAHGFFTEELARLYPRHLWWDENEQGMLMDMRRNAHFLGDVLRKQRLVYLFGRDPKSHLARLALPGLKWTKLKATEPNLNVWKVEL